MAEPGTSARVRSRPRDGGTDGERRQDLLRSVPVAEPADQDPAVVARRIVEDVLREHRQARPDDERARGSRVDALAAPTRAHPAARPHDTVSPAPTGRVGPDPEPARDRVVADEPPPRPRRPEWWLVVLAAGLFAYVVSLVLGLGALSGVFEGRLSDEAPAPVEPAAEPGDLPPLPEGSG